MINRVLLEKYKDLTEDIKMGYSKFRVVDDFDWQVSNPYTIFYVNKNVYVDKVKKLWNTVLSDMGEDATYDEIIDVFLEKAEADDMDIIELPKLDAYTDHYYELGI